MPKTKQNNEQMTCMEVWGGNGITNKSIEMLGLVSRLYSKPYGGSENGGDIYYISSCATGRIIRLLVADVSGHGSQVKQPAEELKGLMRRYINQIDQKNFVKALNRSILLMSHGGLFATAVVASYFAPTRTFTLTNAGHPYPAYFDGATGKWSYLRNNEQSNRKPTDIPLGVLAVSDYHTLQKQVEHGDFILCYTDALIECRDAQGDLLGIDGFLSFLNGLGRVDSNKLIPTILNRLTELSSDNLKGDDVTLMLCSPNRRFETSYKQPSIKQHMQIMGNMLSRIFSKDKPVPWPDWHPANIGGAMFKSLNRLWGRKLRK